MRILLLIDYLNLVAYVIIMVHIININVMIIQYHDYRPNVIWIVGLNTLEKNESTRLNRMDHHSK